MRTAYCPKNHSEIASTSAGREYGHVPGHLYRDVDVVVSQGSTGKYRVHVVESWGSHQGYDEEHGRLEVMGRGDDIGTAMAEARDRAKKVGIDPKWLESALGKAEDEAEEWLENQVDAS